jgi:hypothetical protein
LNSVTQSTQATSASRSPTDPAQLVPPGGVTSGQLATKPISAGVTSSPPPHSPSGPPQTAQIASTLRSSAASIRRAARCSQCGWPGPSWRRRQSARASDLSRRNRVVARPITAWQRFTAEPVPNSLVTSAP